MRFDPFRELDRITQTAAARNPLPMDAYRQGDQVVIHLDVPGLEPASIDLSVEKNVLTVKAERTWARTEGDEWVVAERPQGSVSRQLFLGENLDVERVQASCEQ